MLTKHEMRLVNAAEQNSGVATEMLLKGFDAYGTDFCLRTAHSAFLDCQETFADISDPEDQIIQVILLLGACRVIELFSEFRAKGNEANES